MTFITRLFLPALAAFLVLSGPVNAQSEAEKAALAKSFLDHNMAMMDLDKVSLSAVRPILASLKRLNPDMSAEQTKKAEDVSVQSMKAVMVEAMYGLDKDLVELFTYEELKALDDFYRTAEGQSVLKKMPVYMQKVQPRILRAVMTSAPALNKALEAQGLKVR